ncbi:MAG TPA: hypothetical protein VLH79_12745 [Chthonomonadales bacterium]|nr:hypothetical protein [Chthonomonadales bacterium]
MGSAPIEIEHLTKVCQITERDAGNGASVGSLSRRLSGDARSVGDVNYRVAPWGDRGLSGAERRRAIRRR